MAYINFEADEYVDDISTSALIQELKKRKVLPKSFVKPIDEKFDLNICSKTPKIDALTDFLKLNALATLEEIQKEVEQIYTQGK